MNSKWIGPVVLLAALVIGDQVRLNRPAHKYRLSIAVDTPEGLKSASGVMAVHPDRSYSREGSTRTKGDAVFVDLGAGKNLVVLLTQGERGSETDGMNYIAMRAYRAAGRNISFGDVYKQTGSVPVTGAQLPVLVTFTQLSDPNSMRVVEPENFEQAFGAGTKLRGVSVETIPNGFWPLDFGGVLGEPVTREIASKLPWWDGTEAPAIAAIQAAKLDPKLLLDPKILFVRK